MYIHLNISSFSRSPSQKVDLSQFHETSIQILIGFTCLLGIGFALAGGDLGFGSLDAVILALGLIIPGMVAMFLFPSNARWSLWILYLDWLACGMMLVLSPAMHFALVLLAFPIFLAVLFIGPFMGLLTWLGTASLTYFWFSQSPAIGLPPGWGVFFFTSGVFVGILWLCLRSYQEMIAWSWQNYEQNSAELNQAREQRGQLNQAVHDLAEANTQMMRLNQLLNAARYQAEEAERVKAEFVANVSHELRTPLNMILGYCELIMDFPAVYGRKLPAKLLADIAAIQRNSQHLVTLINDVLDISRIEAQKMVLRKDWVSIQSVVKEVVIAIQPLVESRSLYLRTEVQEDVPLLYIDQTRIRQVLLNLVSNAARVTESGGITIRAQSDENFLKVSISDTGPGIGAESLSHLFQPFSQLDGSLKQKFGGSGLGLNISRNFVELHGGKIGVESQVGQGSTFWFLLPVRDRLPSDSGFERWLSSEYDQHMHPSYANRTRILPRVVVLEPSNQVYKQASHSVSEVEMEQAYEPAEALSLLNASPCQAVLVRGETPQQSEEWGQMVCCSRFTTPVITFTLPVEPVQQLEVDRYLLKPVDHRDLFEAILSLDRPVRSILLVDDDVETLQLFTRLLTTHPDGYRVLQATNGEEGLNLMKSRSVDLVLLDLAMPGMDGYTFLKEKALQPAWDNIAVIILSAEDPRIHPPVVPSLTVMRQNGFSLADTFRCAIKIGEI